MKKSLTKLSIVNAQFYSYHGVKEEEKKLGGKYEVDLDLYYDATTAIISDDVKDAVNYEEAMYCITEVIDDEDSYNLVETISNEILNTIMDRYPIVKKSTVRVRKLTVPIRQIINYIQAEQTIERPE